MVFFIPLMILIILTYKLRCAVKRAKVQKKTLITRMSQSNAMSGHLGGRSRVFDDVTPALVCVMMAFMVCQMFNPVQRLLKYLIPPEKQTCWSFFFVFSPFSGTAVLFNSAVNFVILVLVAKEFRRHALSCFR